jgi:hypothetical protein
MSIDKLKTVYSTGTFLNNVKTFFSKINEIIDYLNGTSGNGSYKVYTAILTQTGTADPTITVLNNTIGNITVSRYGGGIIEFNSISKLKINKRVVFISPPSNLDYPNNYFQSYDDEGVSDDYYRLVQKEMSTGDPMDNFSNIQIEIRVYN